MQATLKKVYGNNANEELSQYSEKMKHNQRIIIQNLLRWKNPMEQGSHKNLNDDGKQFMIDFATRIKAKLMPLAKNLTANEIEVNVLLYIMR